MAAGWGRRIVAALLLFCAGLAAPAWAARPLSKAERQLVGTWQDDKDPQNIIRFLPNHRVQIYVPKKTGEYMQVHWMPGTWRLFRGRVLKMKLTITTDKGVIEVRHTTFHITFVRKRMVVRLNGKVIGRQHRLSRAQLQKYLW